MDLEYIAGLGLIAVTVMMGVTIFLLLGIRDKVKAVSKRIDAQGSRFGKLIDWLESNDVIARKSKK